MKKFKKLLSVMLAIACMCGLIPASAGAASTSTGTSAPLTLTSDTNKIDFLSGATLTVTNNSSTNKIKKVAWSSSDTSIATVESESTKSNKATAYVRGFKGGTATITAKVQMSDGKTYSKSKKYKSF